MARIYEQVDVSALTLTEATGIIFTSTEEVPRRLKRITTNNATATIDLLVYDDRELICDLPLDADGIVNNWIDFDRDIKPGHQVKVGHRNGTGGTVVVAICAESEIPD